MKVFKIIVFFVLIFGLVLPAASQKKKVKDKEKDPQYEYEKAVVAMNYGLPEEAIKYIDQALALDPRHYQSLNLLGMIHLQKGNYAEAASALEKCVGIKPDFPDGHNNLGTAYLNIGLKDKALAEYQEAFGLNGNVFAGFNLAKLCLERNELPAGLDYIEKTIQKSPRESGAHNLKGVILNEMKRYPEAIASFHKALSLNPFDVNVNVNLGIAYMNNKQLDKALENFEKALPSIKDPALKTKVAEYIKLIKEAGK